MLQMFSMIKSILSLTRRFLSEVSSPWALQEARRWRVISFCPDLRETVQTKKWLCFEDFFLFVREHLGFQFNAINGIIASGRFRSRSSLKDHRKGSWGLGRRIILFPIPDFVEEKCFRPSHDGRWETKYRWWCARCLFIWLQRILKDYRVGELLLAC